LFTPYNTKTISGAKNNPSFKSARPAEVVLEDQKKQSISNLAPVAKQSSDNGNVSFESQPSRDKLAFQ